MTITTYTDREIAIAAKLSAMTADRDEYQKTADKMAMDHKVERDTLRQQLAESQSEVARLEQDRDEWKDSTISANANAANEEKRRRAMQEERDALRQQLAAALQLAKLNGEIAAELKSDKLALEAAIEASQKQEAVATVEMHPDGRRRTIFKDSVTDCDASWKETQKLYAAPVVAPDVHYAGLMEVMKDIVKLWDHHCYEHGDGMPSPLHCRAKEAIAAIGGAND